MNTGSIHSRSEPAEQLVGADALRLQPSQHIEQRLRLRRPALALVIAAAANAVHPFGGVHGLEIGGEGARQRFGAVGVQPGQRIGQAIDRLALAAAPDGGGAHLLDALEEGLAILLGQHLPDHGAEPADVLAQRAVVGQKVGFAVDFHKTGPGQ